MATSQDDCTAIHKFITLQEFENMAKLGRIHMAVEDSVQPSKGSLNKAESPVDFGRLYGYSEEDIACFYLKRRGGRADIAYAEYIHDLKCAKFPRSKQITAK
jgi:hypothetical protein